MDVAEMKIAGAKKGSAKPNVGVVQGEALAATIVNWAWKEAEHVEKQAGKLAMFVQDISKLSAEAHTAFRNQLTQELAAVRELDKVSGMGESKTNGYALNSFVVRVSQLKAISEACQLGMKVPADAQWSVTLERAREYRKTHVSANGGKTSGGRSAGQGGRKALTDFDKAMRLINKLNLRDLRKVAAAVGGLIEAAETGKRPKQAANQPTAQAAA
jgi:hypothetical protein